MTSRLIGVLFTLGCAALSALSWWHSWPWLADDQPFPDIGGRRNDNPAAEVLQTLSLCGLFVAYLYVLVRWSRFQLTPRTVMLIAVAPALLMLAALPVNSNDVFAYLSFGRIAAVHGANPYIHTYSEFPDDFSRYVTWNLRMGYGPFMLPPLMLAGWLSVHSVVLAIFALKAMWLVTHVCNCIVLYQILKGWRGDPVFGLFLFAVNPLILLEQLGNGHNDGLMILAGLLAIWAVQRKRFVAALLLALVAALVKLPGAIFGAAILAYLVRNGEWRRAALGIAAGVALMVPLAIIFFPDLDAVRPMTLSGFYLTNSLHVLPIEGLSQHGGRLGIRATAEEIFAIDRTSSALLLVAFCAWRSCYIRNMESLVGELAHVFLALLIGYVAWFFPWYATWVVPLAAMVSSVRLRWAIVAYSWSVLALYAFPRVLLDEVPFHGVWEILRLLIAHAVPLIVLFRMSPNDVGRE